MLKRKNSLIVIAVLFLLAFNAFALRRSESQPSSSDAVLYISPSVIADPTLTPPAIVGVNVSMSNVTDMAYCEFKLGYTPNIFYVVELAKQPVQGQIPSMYYEVEDYLGYVYVRLTYSNAVSVNGNATLLVINFAVVNYGITTLHFQDVLIKDDGGNTIPFQTQDGYLAIFKHDIAVTSVTASPNETYTGRTVQITVTLQNYGNLPETFTTTIYSDGKNITALQALDLLPNETRILTYDWNTTGFAANNTPYNIKAEAEILPYETNTTNNVYVDGPVKLKLIGDVNGDSVVDNLDGHLILQNYRSSL